MQHSFRQLFWTVIYFKVRTCYVTQLFFHGFVSKMQSHRFYITVVFVWGKDQNKLLCNENSGNKLLVLVHVTCFQVYAWGCGACLGCGSSEATALRPKLIEELATTRVVDISIGDSHCLALSHGSSLSLCPSLFSLKAYLQMVNCK